MFAAAYSMTGDPLACLELILSRFTELNVEMMTKTYNKTLLIAACERGNLSLVKRIVAGGADINKTVEVLDFIADDVGDRGYYETNTVSPLIAAEKFPEVVEYLKKLQK